MVISFFEIYVTSITFIFYPLIVRKTSSSINSGVSFFVKENKKNVSVKNILAGSSERELKQRKYP